MKKEDIDFYKEPFKNSLRNRINKITCPPYNLKKKDIVKKADINHRTLSDFLNDITNTRTDALRKIDKVISSFEKEKGLYS